MMGFASVASLVGGSILSSAFGGGKKDADPAPAPAPAAEPAKPKTQDAALREQSPGQRASAGGLLGSDNEADMLGYTQPKRRGAGRALLG